MNQFAVEERKRKFEMKVFQCLCEAVFVAKYEMQGLPASNRLSLLLVDDACASFDSFSPLQSR